MKKVFIVLLILFTLNIESAYSFPLDAMFSEVIDLHLKDSQKLNKYLLKTKTFMSKHSPGEAAIIMQGFREVFKARFGMNSDISVEGHGNFTFSLPNGAGTVTYMFSDWTIEREIVNYATGIIHQYFPQRDSNTIDLKITSPTNYYIYLRIDPHLKQAKVLDAHLPKIEVKLNKDISKSQQMQLIKVLKNRGVLTTDQASSSHNLVKNLIPEALDHFLTKDIFYDNKLQTRVLNALVVGDLTKEFSTFTMNFIKYLTKN